MKNKTQHKFALLFLLSIITQISCSASGGLVINNSHLDYLYEEINIDGKEMAIIHIYSDAPDYTFVGDDDEGIACVDDVARAAIYYHYDYQINSNKESLNKNKKLVEFVLHLQADNGYFYNFVWGDYSINEDFKTSVAEPNWWSWRALWVLAESYEVYKDVDADFAERIWDSIERIIDSIKKDIPKENKYENIAGLETPSWLPRQYASDQASVLLLGLSKYYEQTKDEVIYNYMRKLCDGIVAMQVNGESSEFNGAFLSWENTWHAWGNSQSYSLLKCYQLTNDESYLNAAKNELDNFYKYLLNNNFLNSFSVEMKDGQIVTIQNEKFSQIAYNIRPMVFALLEAYKITGEEKYAEQASNTASWFLGNNPANAIIYDKDSGRIYDGINSVDDVNKNSGAESTIEGLLSLMKIKSTPAALKHFMKDE